MTTATQVRLNVDQIIIAVQREYPYAAIRVTGRARTIRRQAELMAQRIRADRHEFLRTYAPKPHIREMDNWTRAHPQATLEETVGAFEGIIRDARVGGEVVSNHLSDTARDVSWPIGSPATLDAIEARIRELGGSVIREPNAAGGRHWHIDH